MPEKIVEITNSEKRIKPIKNFNETSNSNQVKDSLSAIIGDNNNGDFLRDSRDSIIRH